MNDLPEAKLESVKEYYATGELKSDGSYLNKKRHGLYRTYWRNGKLQNEGNYVNDVPVGEEKCFHRDGTLFRQNIYLGEAGNMDEKEFYKSGKLRCEGSIRKHAPGLMKDTASSFFRIYYENGQVALEWSRAVGGRESTWQAWDEQGRKISSEYERALVQYKTSIDKDEEVEDLISLGQAALKEQRLAEASQIAKEIITFTLRSRWARKDMMIFFDQLAFLEGNNKKAGEYLIAGVRQDPFDTCWGGRDDMTLAKWLFDAGEKEVVLAYLGVCFKNAQCFSKKYCQQLTQWMAEIADGKNPDFLEVSKQGI
ncbi:MAG: hypothetical protein WCI27_02470 [Candidatus Omnitrophota bacterium]